MPVSLCDHLMSVVPAQQMRLDVWAVMMRPVIIAHSYIEFEFVEL